MYVIPQYMVQILVVPLNTYCFILWIIGIPKYLNFIWNMKTLTDGVYINMHSDSWYCMEKQIKANEMKWNEKVTWSQRVFELNYLN